MSLILSRIDDIVNQLQKELLSFRIDIKNCGSKNDAVIVEGNGVKIFHPEWFKNEEGQGVVVEGNSYEQEITVQIPQAGKLKIGFRGQDKRFNGKRFPLKIYYTSIKINDREILTKPVSVWHDEPYKYEISTREGDKLMLDVKICPYNHDKTVLEDFILQHTYQDNVVKQNIARIVDAILVDNLSKQNQRLTQYCDTLEDRLNKLELLSSSLQQGNSAYCSIPCKQEDRDNILKEAHNNLWVLKDIVQKKTGNEKTRYERVYNELCNSKGCWIGSGAKFATIPTLPHGFHGIFVSGGAKIGKHCVIYQNVTIGSNTVKGSTKNGSPEIGDDVLIGAGAKIIGKIKIGNNVRIGAGCAVAIDVPDDSVVVSQKPIIIHKENMDNRFYHYENGKYGYVEDGIFHPVDKE